MRLRVLRMPPTCTERRPGRKHGFSSPVRRGSVRLQRGLFSPRPIALAHRIPRRAKGASLRLASELHSSSPSTRRPRCRSFRRTSSSYAHAGPMPPARALAASVLRTIERMPSCSSMSWKSCASASPFGLTSTTASSGDGKRVGASLRPPSQARMRVRMLVAEGIRDGGGGGIRTLDPGYPR